MTAPTLDEIRRLVEGQLADDGSLNPAGQVNDGFAAIQGVLARLYDEDELRPSEDEELLALSYAATEPIRARAMRECVDALIAAGVAFAATHPGTPRARTADGRPLVSARKLQAVESPA